MTDEEKIKAVTAKLSGGFYVGQRVRIDSPMILDSCIVIVAELGIIDDAGHSRVRVQVDDGREFTPVTWIVTPYD